MSSEIHTCNNISTAVILAGGLGTRLRTMVKDIPKPMAPVNGRPFLAYVLDFLDENGIRKAILSVGYKYQLIQDYFGDNYKNISLVYAVEEEPLGTGGAIMHACRYAGIEPFVLVNGDTLFEADISGMKDMYLSRQADLVLGLKKMKSFDRYGTVEMDSENRVLAFNEKTYCEEGWINGGVYIMSKKAFEVEEFPLRFSFEKDFLEKYVHQLRFFGLPADAYFIDIGVPEDYTRAQLEFS